MTSESSAELESVVRQETERLGSAMSDIVGAITTQFPDSFSSLSAFLGEWRSIQEEVIELLLFCTGHPQLDAAKLAAQYSAALFTVGAGNGRRHEIQEVTGPRVLTHKQRSGHTQATRAHDALIRAAAQLIFERGTTEWKIHEVRGLSGTGYSTIYKYFNSREALIVVAFRHLIATY